MSDFSYFQQAVAGHFQGMVPDGLYRVDVDRDLLWETYLGSFPEGSNPMFRKRTEHDCSCCRQFVKQAGDIVAIKNGEIVTVWDVHDTLRGHPAYQAVASAMASLVRSRPIRDQFLHYEDRIGTRQNHEAVAGKDVVTWNHFHVDLPARGRNAGRNYVARKDTIATTLGEVRSTHDVMLRSLKELTMDAVDTALDLIAQKDLYRGEEHENTLKTFRKLKEAFDKLTDDRARDIFVWQKMETAPGAVARVRNTSIGTLLVDLSEGLDLDQAVRKFESVVAPANYKRPKSLVTQKMVDAARQTVEELGLTSALDRRFARLSDVNVNNIIFADRSARKAMKGDSPFDGVANKTPDRKLDRVEAISIDDFIKDVVPRAVKIEVLLENKHRGNLVSLIAPKDPAAKRLFKWENNFSWAYEGGNTDSIKERVKQAGGNVTGDLCCRLSWFNYDDLDLHLVCPRPGRHIYYGDRGLSPFNGMLDVDMNAGGGRTRTPVENIFFEERERMPEGEYHLYVHQFARRESVDVGFEVEIDFMGDVHSFAYQKPVTDNVTVAKFTYSRKDGLKITHSLSGAKVSREMWALKTQEFHPVGVLMRSPNYWNEQHGIGNQHYFFMLDGCQNDGDARGFFNEFLLPDLDKHRKVLEIVGGKTKVEKVDDQLSGVGFSTTKRDEVVVRVKGSVTRTLKVMI